MPKKNVSVDCDINRLTDNENKAIKELKEKILQKYPGAG